MTQHFSVKNRYTGTGWMLFFQNGVLYKGSSPLSLIYNKENMAAIFNLLRCICWNDEVKLPYEETFKDAQSEIENITHIINEKDNFLRYSALLHSHSCVHLQNCIV
jgi:hypothetical protein